MTFLKNARDLLLVVPALVTLAVLRCYVWVFRMPSAVFRDEAGSPYMTRYFLTRSTAREYLSTGKSGAPGPYLHHFHRGDYDRRLHNHPWEYAWSWILSGGYVEERIRPTPAALFYWQEQGFVSRVPLFEAYLAGSVNRIRENDFHRVSLASDHGPLPGLFGWLACRQTWTLFYSGPKTGNRWGFLQDDGTVSRAPEYDARPSTLRDPDDEPTLPDAGRTRPERRCKCGETRNLVFKFNCYRCPVCT
jgi:hypothetical protein